MSIILLFHVTLFGIWIAYSVGHDRGYAQGKDVGYEAGRVFADMEAKGETFRLTVHALEDK